MLALDASSIIWAWDTFFHDQFPPLWRWVEKNIREQEFSIAEVALDQVQNKYPPCADFLKAADISVFRVDEDIALEALRINSLLGIREDKYHPKGVDENDVLIIATASVRELELVSDESAQQKQPKENAKLKMPAVCQLPDVDVECINFLELIRRSREVFE